MSKKDARGTKRTCQNGQCGSRFYDLNRDPITCPVCATEYRLAMSAAATAVAAAAPAAVAEKAVRRPAKKPDAVAPVPVPADLPAAEGEEALIDVESAEEPIAADSDETFLEEEEEDGSDMTGIIGGVDGEDEEP